MNVGLIFGIIFAAILIGFLLFFGFGGVNNLFGISSNAQMGQQIMNLKAKIKSTFNLGYESVQPFKLIIPMSVDKICFVDVETPVSNPRGNWESNKFLESYVKKYGYNLLVFKAGSSLPEGYKVEKMKPYENFCITGTSKLELKNMGSYVEVRPEE